MQFLYSIGKMIVKSTVLLTFQLCSLCSNILFRAHVYMLHAFNDEIHFSFSLYCTSWDSYYLYDWQYDGFTTWFGPDKV